MASNPVLNLAPSSSPCEWAVPTNEGVIVSVHVRPGAKKDATMGYFNGRLKVSLAAPPVDGKANERLVRWLSKKLGLSRSSVVLLSGQTSRDKRLLVKGLSLEALLKALA